MSAYEDAGVDETCDLCGENVFNCDCTESDFAAAPSVEQNGSEK